MVSLLDQLAHRWWDISYKETVRDAIREARSEHLSHFCAEFLAKLQDEENSTRALTMLDFITRPSVDPEMSKRLIDVYAFRTGLERAARPSGVASDSNSTAFSRPQRNCQSALRMLYRHMDGQKEFTFKCVTGGTIRILENRAFGAQATCKNDGTLKTGGVVWEAAHCLVDLMQGLGEDFFRGKSVLELGAGCGYVGIVAARMGAVVTVTDREDHLEHLHANVCRNGFEHTVRVAELEWADPASSGLWDCSYDWILASDCVYEEDSHEHLARTLCALSKPDGSTVILMSQETRSDLHSSFFLRGRAPAEDHDRPGTHANFYNQAADACSQAPPHLHEGKPGLNVYPEQGLNAYTEDRLTAYTEQGTNSHPEQGLGSGESLLHFSVRQIEPDAFRRPDWCHESQDIQIFCLTKPERRGLPGVAPTRSAEVVGPQARQEYGGGGGGRRRHAAQISSCEAPSSCSCRRACVQGVLDSLAGHQDALLGRLDKATDRCSTNRCSTPHPHEAKQGLAAHPDHDVRSEGSAEGTRGQRHVSGLERMMLSDLRQIAASRHCRTSAWPTCVQGCSEDCCDLDLDELD